jgi:hypothetical protein
MTRIDTPVHESIINIRGGRVGLGPLDPTMLANFTRWINDFETVRTLALDLSQFVSRHHRRPWRWPTGPRDGHCQPELGRLVDRLPRRQVVGHEASLEMSLGDITQPTEVFAQGMPALRGVLARQREAGDQEGPFLSQTVRLIGGARASMGHSIPARNPNVHNGL